MRAKFVEHDPRDGDGDGGVERVGVVDAVVALARARERDEGEGDEGQDEADVLTEVIHRLGEHVKRRGGECGRATTGDGMRSRRTVEDKELSYLVRIGKDYLVIGKETERERASFHASGRGWRAFTAPAPEEFARGLGGGHLLHPAAGRRTSDARMLGANARGRVFDANAIPWVV